ncbi:Protein smf (fragment) [Mesorhizobium plurifarium]|uniref:Protein smf n=2 Tax=Mesorhizobium TaxID=68287 RepID=A0A090F9C4_MESPL
MVGAHEATDDKKQRSRQLARDLTVRKRALGKDGFTIVSGLAAGIDRVAHETAMTNGGRTIAAIGTPLSTYHPKEDGDLQERIPKEFLLISQIPLLRDAAQAIPQNLLFCWQ